MDSINNLRRNKWEMKGWYIRSLKILGQTLNVIIGLRITELTL